MGNLDYDSRIDGDIDAEEIQIGKGVVVESGVTITGKEGAAKRVVLGDFCFIGRKTRIIAPEFKIGDYTKLHAYSFGHGEKPMGIGRNCWLGQNTILDSNGGLDIDDNVGIGAYSQIWTHMQFGDVVEGCQFNSRRYMHIGKDAWLVGHCVVSPVEVGEKSMALVGSVVTQNMLANHVYAGVPAQDVTAKMGKQFKNYSNEQKAAKLQDIIDKFIHDNPRYKGQLKVITSPEERQDGICWFDVSCRVYNKTYSEAEVAFLKVNIPLVKFVPVDDPPFITPQTTAV